MKAAGILLIVFSAVWGYLVYRRSALQALRLIRALEEELGVLRCQICVYRRSLPAILDGELCRGVGGKFLWTPLSKRLRVGEGTIGECWERTVATLPREIAVRLSPLGSLLSIGGESLARAIDEVREELLLLERDRQERQKVDLRLSAAVCFSLAALFILAFA